MNFSFYVEESECGNICETCSKIIEKGDITVRTLFYLKVCYFHLDCYTPALEQYICKEELQICLSNTENQKTFNLWLENWNKNYPTINAPETLLTSKFVYSKLSTHRRLWLEVFKFLNAKEIALSFSCVNKDFYLISCDEELWYFNLIRDYGRFEINIKNYKRQYIVLALRTCYWCHQNWGNTIGNLFNKKICRDCQDLWRFEKLSAEEVFFIYKIDLNLLDLKFDNSESEELKQTYKYMVWEAVKKYQANKYFGKAIIKIIVVGEKNVGKTSLINRYAGNVNFLTNSYCDFDYLRKKILVDDMIEILHIWDKAGLEGYSYLYDKCDCCVLVYDITSLKSFKKLDRFKSQILSIRNNENFPFIVFGNKVDRENEREVENERVKKWCIKNGNIPYYETSALDNINLDNGFREIVINALMRQEIAKLADQRVEKVENKKLKCMIF